MEICNVKRINLNNKLIQNIDSGEVDLDDYELQSDKITISSITTSKTLRDFILNKLRNELERHNFMNSVLYYNSMVDKDCYTFYLHQI